MDIKLITNKEELKKPCNDILTIEEAIETAKLLREGVLLFNGVGLAANQIGINKKMAIIKDDKQEYIYLINPEVISAEGEFIVKKEGCLSFPGKYFQTKRYEHYVIKNHIIDGDKFREEIQYYYSDKDKVNKDDRTRQDIQGICCQHEIEHIINNRVIIDYGIFDYEIVNNQIIKNNIGRNDPCPCGKKDINGKPLKYKKCCG
jgi:peptide deformylase